MTFLAPLSLLLAIVIGASSPALSTASPVRGTETATTPGDPELRPWIPITKPAAANPVPVMSIKRAEVPDLRSGDQLALNAELQVTTDCRERSPRCAGSVYSYSPSVVGRLVLRPERRGADPVFLGPQQKLRCVQRRPARQHHCVLVFPTKEVVLGPRQADCLTARCSIDLDISATNRRAGAGDRLVIGGHKPNGSIVPGHGKIGAIRIPGPAEEPRQSSSEDLLVRSVPLDLHPRSVLSLRVRRIGAFAVDARFRSAVSSTGFNDLVNSQLVVARSSRETRSIGYARIGPSEGAISASNGTNCTLAQGSCLHRKAGVVSIGPGDLPGKRPLFVNLVVRAKPKYHGGASGPASSHNLPIPSGLLKLRAYGSG